MDLRIHEFDLPLRHTFTIARGSINQQKTLIAELMDDRFSGYGEATTNDYYGFTFQNMADALQRVRPILVRTKLDDPTKLWDACAEELRGNPFAQCALDQAAHDLWGKKLEQPVYRLWGLDVNAIPASNYTIGIDSIDKMVEKLNEYPGWPIYKIKLGTKEDLEIVRALRKHTNAIFRVDANCGWTAEQTISNSRSLRDLGVEFIEQPLPADRWNDMKRVYAESALPIIADESCIVESDVARCEGHFHGINIKLVKCGGLTPARRMIANARNLNMKVMVGCMTESTVGISAIAQLLPLLDYVDMDGAVLLAKDIATGVTVEKGICHFPTVNGNGVTLVG
jgi:L-alanine-DL-glutamate epimerase-like enolase superfamily enzyme